LHFRITGGGAAATYGITVYGESQGIQIRRGGSNWELDRVHFAGAKDEPGLSFLPRWGTAASWPYAGLAPSKATFLAQNIHIHHNLFAEPTAPTAQACALGQAMTEGIYFGNSWLDGDEPQITGVVIEYNIFRDTCWEAAQVGSILEAGGQCAFRFNHISRDSIEGVQPSQVGGFRMERLAYCDVTDNVFIDSHFAAILVSGPNGDTRKPLVADNVIVRANRSATTHGAIQVGVEDGVRNGVRIENNTIVEPTNGIGVKLASSATNVLLVDNLLVGASYNLGGGVTHTILPGAVQTQMAAGFDDFDQTFDPFGAGYYRNCPSGLGAR
jgi:hypothetical protein